jgi:hypothetical protein
VLGEREEGKRNRDKGQGEIGRARERDVEIGDRERVRGR